MAALAGALFALHLNKAVARDWTTDFSLVLVAMVIIGGLGSSSGAVIGAFIVYALPRLLHFSNGYVVPIGIGLLLIVVITRLPGGVAGLIQSVRERAVRALVEKPLGSSPGDAPPPAPVPVTTASSGG